VLHWLLSGQLLDFGRLPVITVFAALGFGLAWLAWSSVPDACALLAALAVCLLFAFGRTTFGPLALSGLTLAVIAVAPACVWYARRRCDAQEARVRK
jgi:hypothetical protein